MLNEVFTEDEGLTYIPMLASNSSSLEGKFGSQQRTVHNYSHTYSGGITNKDTKQTLGAMGNDKNTTGYSHDDCLQVVNDRGVTQVGSAVFQDNEGCYIQQNQTATKEKAISRKCSN